MYYLMRAPRSYLISKLSGGALFEIWQVALKRGRYNYHDARTYVCMYVCHNGSYLLL